MKLQLKAVVSRGWYKLLDSHLACQFLSQFPPNTEILVTYQESKPKVWKTYDQLKMIHAIIKLYANAQGLVMEKAKDDFKDKFGYYDYRENPLTKETKKNYLSFRECSKEQMNEFIESGLSILEWLGYSLPPTNDMLSLYNFIDNQFK